MNESWIKLYRKFLYWGWFKNSQMVHLFIYFLLKANSTDREFEGQIIKRGQFITSRAIIHDDTGISEQTIRTCLKKMQSSKEISVKSTKAYTLITVSQYDYYNVQKLVANQQLTNGQPTANQQLTTSKEYKEYKNILEVSNETSSSSAKAEDGFSLTPPPTEIISKNQKEKIDCKKFVDFWNKTVANTRVPLIKKLADSRRNTLCARMSTYGKKAIFEAVEKIPKSDFLSGRATDFKVTFDWVFGPKNFPKVLDGNYDNDNFKGNDNRQETSDRRRGYDARTHSAEEYEKDF